MDLLHINSQSADKELSITGCYAEGVTAAMAVTGRKGSCR